MAKQTAWVRTLVLGLVLAAPLVATRAQEQGQETRPFTLPELRVVAPHPEPLSPYITPHESRTDTSIHGVPASITVIPRTLIDEQKALTLDDVLRNVSGIARNAGRGFWASSIHTWRVAMQCHTGSRHYTWDASGDYRTARSSV